MRQATRSTGNAQCHPLFAQGSWYSSLVYSDAIFGVMKPDADTLNYTPKELCSRIATLTGSIMDFWKYSSNWAPAGPSGLLQKSMLEWQTSLALSLKRWIRADSQGDLILAWANLGALVEGQLKLFLCVYYDDYARDVNAIRKRGKLADPDGCELEPLRLFFVERIWDAGSGWNPYVHLVQQRRNAIHAYRRRDIGTFAEWKKTLPLHLSFVRDVGGGLPYPDEQFSGLKEE
jgi:hypothetical protein